MHLRIVYPHRPWGELGVPRMGVPSTGPLSRLCSDSGAPYLLCKQAMMCPDRASHRAGLKRGWNVSGNVEESLYGRQIEKKAPIAVAAKEEGVSHRADPSVPRPERLDSLRTLQVAFT